MAFSVCVGFSSYGTVR
ncbi:hypothetical protein P3632_22980 [Vibrio parahaemolyticus]|nr:MULTISPECIES: hypothetical protein [Vibrio]MCG6291422.1 hypothetical protein [Vibrio vulnificus]MCU8255761.1 hypothetical protein [Vibrio vulnificus]MCU8313314.1 hypothetical protein [Vibrio vulnificus]MCU8452608.1 hypothetical protein [Vibrio vulnificus]MDF5019660.1 hypothetical protein [Vibrio parahaemolyticus]